MPSCTPEAAACIESLYWRLHRAGVKEAQSCVVAEGQRMLNRFPTFQRPACALCVGLKQSSSPRLQIYNEVSSTFLESPAVPFVGESCQVRHPHIPPLELTIIPTLKPSAHISSISIRLTTVEYLPHPVIPPNDPCLIVVSASPFLFDFKVAGTIFAR